MSKMTDEQAADYAAALEREREGYVARGAAYERDVTRHEESGDDVEALKARRAHSAMSDRVTQVDAELERVRGGGQTRPRGAGKQTRSA